MFLYVCTGSDSFVLGKGWARGPSEGPESQTFLAVLIVPLSFSLGAEAPSPKTQIFLLLLLPSSRPVSTPSPSSRILPSPASRSPPRSEARDQLRTTLPGGLRAGRSRGGGARLPGPGAAGLLGNGVRFLSGLLAWGPRRGHVNKLQFPAAPARGRSGLGWGRVRGARRGGGGGCGWRRRPGPAAGPWLVREGGGEGRTGKMATAGANGPGSATAAASNPRKFSEKIALQKQRQAEETAAFEEVMMDIGSTRVRGRRGSGSRGRRPGAGGGAGAGAAAREAERGGRRPGGAGGGAARGGKTGVGGAGGGRGAGGAGGGRGGGGGGRGAGGSRRGPRGRRRARASPAECGGTPLQHPRGSGGGGGGQGPPVPPARASPAVRSVSPVLSPLGCLRERPGERFAPPRWVSWGQEVPSCVPSLCFLFQIFLVVS